jgi:transcription initiation factor TFIIB
MSRATTTTDRIDTCPECSGRAQRTADAETVCETCGLVLADRSVEDGPTPRLGTDEQRRTGAPLTDRHANRGLSTWMGTCERDGRDNPIAPERRRRLRRQRMRQRRAAADANRDTLGPGLKELRRVASALDLPDGVVETASVVFRRAVEEDALPGWAYESVASAAVYIAARNAGAVRTLSEVAERSRRGQRRIGRASRHLQRELDLEVSPPSVREYVPAVSDALGLSERMTRRAQALLTAAVEENVHSGRDPTALAASALYTVSLAVEDAPPLCQTDVSEAADSCPLTIRSHFRELRPLCPGVFDVSPDAIQSPTDRAGRRSDIDPDGSADSSRPNPGGSSRSEPRAERS